LMLSVEVLQFLVQHPAWFGAAALYVTSLGGAILWASWDRSDW
jgi:hypothetical protein